MNNYRLLEGRALLSAKKSLMDNLRKHGAEEKFHGIKNREGEEVSFFEKGGAVVLLSSRGGLLVPRTRAGELKRYALAIGFGERREGQFLQEGKDRIFLHRAAPKELSALARKKGFDVLKLGGSDFVKVTTVGGTNAFEQIVKFAKLKRSLKQGSPVAVRSSGRSLNLGSNGGGLRRAATWKGRHLKIAKKLFRELIDLGWEPDQKLGPWQPDILVSKTKAGPRLLIEVKPTASVSNVVTAIGQLLCYRLGSGKSRTVPLLATDGQVEKEHLVTALSTHRIHTLDMRSREWRQKLSTLCQTIS